MLSWWWCRNSALTRLCDCVYLHKWMRLSPRNILDPISDAELSLFTFNSFSEIILYAWIALSLLADQKLNLSREGNGSSEQRLEIDVNFIDHLQMTGMRYYAWTFHVLFFSLLQNKELKAGSIKKPLPKSLKLGMILMNAIIWSFAWSVMFLSCESRRCSSVHHPLSLIPSPKVDNLMKSGVMPPGCECSKCWG